MPLRRLAFLGLAFGAVLISCGKDVTGPGGARFARGLSWNAIFPGPLRNAGVSSSGIVDFDRVHVLLHHSDGSVALDTTIAYPAGTDSLTVSLAVQLLTSAPASGEAMTLDLGYVNATGDTVFKGGPIALTAAPPPAGGGVNPPVQVPVAYSGPGASATSVAIAPRTITAAAAAPFTFTATAKDAGGNALAGTPVIWTSLDPTIATITAPAAGTGVALNLRGTARILAQLLTGAVDTVQLIVTLPASQLLKPATGSGDGQSGAVATALPLPIVVKVAASDGVGVSGTTVAFNIANGGGSVSPTTAISDANGLAQTTWTLGPGAGSQSVGATTAALPGSQLTYTANGSAGAASKLVFVTPPASTTGGAVIAPVVVFAEDPSGNLATSFGGTVTVAFGATTSGATLVGTLTATATAGVAAFPVLAINKVFNGYTLVATSGTLASATSPAFNITTGPAAGLLPTGGFGQTGLINTALPTPIGVRVVDAGGNGVSGKTVTFSTTSGSGSVAPTSVTSDAGGNASTVWTLGATVGIDTAVATVSGITPLKILGGALPNVKVWTGVNSTQWTDPGNWFPALLPSATDSVIIPSTTNKPTISANETVRTLLIAAGAPVTISAGDTLTVAGTLGNAGGIAGPGTVVLSGTGAVVGLMSGALTVTGNYTLGGPLVVSGNVTITGHLVLGGQPMSAAALFSTQGSGTFTMTNAADALNVGGDANFAGGSTAGLITTGTIAFGGHVMVPLAANAFAPSGNNTAAFVGTAQQNVTVAAPTVPTVQNCVSTNAVGVLLASPITIQGNATMGGPVSSAPLTINGTLTDPAVQLTAAGLTLGNATTPLSNTFAILSDVMFTGNAAALNAPLEVFGGVTIAAGNLAVNGQQFFVNGMFATTGTGTLTMNNAADSLLIVGQATFSGGTEAGLLTNGTLGILTSLVASGPGQFAASGSHTTYFAGAANLSVGCGCTLAQLGAAAPARRNNAPRAGTAALPGSTAPRAGAAPAAGAKPSAAVLAARAQRRAAGEARAVGAKAQVASMRALRMALSARWPSRASAVRAARAAGTAARMQRPSASSATLTPRAKAVVAAARAAGTRLMGTRPSGAAPLAGVTVRSGAGFTLPTLNDTVHVAFADTTGNHFANVHITGLTDWQTIARTNGNMLVDTTGYIVGNGHLVIADTLFVSNAGDVEPEAVELFGVLSDSGYFSPDTTIFSGASQTIQSDVLGDPEYNNVIVNSPSLNVLAEDGYDVDIYGSLFVVGAGQLRIGTPMPGNACFGCESDYVWVGGALETHGSGTLAMTDTVSYPYLEVDDSAYFAGGSTAGLLTQGEIDFYGNFRQAGSPSAFAATSPHFTYFESIGQTITFANPGYGSSSHFGDLYFDEYSETVDFYLNSNVFADGSLETGCIECEFSHHLHAGTPGVGITSKGASIGNVLFDGVTWALQDGYPVYSANLVDFENQDPTKIQFSILRSDSIPIAPGAIFSNWVFGTLPTTGLYLDVTQTDNGSLGPLTVSFTNLSIVQFGFASNFNGAVILGWNFGGGDAEVSDVTHWMGDRLGVGGTSASHAGTVNGGTSGPVTPLKALRF